MLRQAARLRRSASSRPRAASAAVAAAHPYVSITRAFISPLAQRTRRVEAAECGIRPVSLLPPQALASRRLGVEEGGHARQAQASASQPPPPRLHLDGKVSLGLPGEE